MEEVEAVFGLEPVQDGIDEGRVPVVTADRDVRVRQVAAAVAGGQDLAPGLRQLLDQHDVHPGTGPLQRDRRRQARRTRANNERSQTGFLLLIWFGKLSGKASSRGEGFADLRCLWQMKQGCRTGRNKERREALQTSEATMFLTVRVARLFSTFSDLTKYTVFFHKSKSPGRHDFR